MPVSLIIGEVASSGLSPSVVAVMIGAGAALITGIILAALNAWYQSNEKKRERTMALRREVYLPLAAAMPAVLTYLIKLPTLLEVDEKPMGEFNACTQKLATVAETSTAILATEASTALGIEFMALFKLAQPSLQALREMGLAKERKDAAYLKSETIQARIDDHFHSGGVVDARFESFRHHHAFHLERAVTHGHEESASSIKHARETLLYLTVLIAILPKLDAMRFQLTMALRNDMDLKTDEPAFKAASDGQCARMVSALTVMIAKGEGELDALEGSNTDTAVVPV